MILIFSAPSGSGKSTLVQHLLDTRQDIELSISATTRAPRGQEQDGREYYFITPERFEQLIKEDAFVEWQQVYKGTYYGTLRSEIERIENAGHHVVFDIDVKGGINVKRMFGDRALAIFISPPSIEALRERLRSVWQKPRLRWPMRRCLTRFWSTTIWLLPRKNWTKNWQSS